MTRAEFDAVYRPYRAGQPLRQALRHRLTTDVVDLQYIGLRARPWWIVYLHVALFIGFVAILVAAVLFAGRSFAPGTQP